MCHGRTSEEEGGFLGPEKDRYMQREEQTGRPLGPVDYLGRANCQAWWQIATARVCVKMLTRKWPE